VVEPCQRPLVPGKRQAILPGRRSGKAIQYKSTFTVGFPQPAGDDAVHQLVRDQLASGHDRLGFKAQRGTARYMVAQKIAGRYLRDTVTVDNLFGLVPFRPRGSEEESRVQSALPIFCAVSLATYWPSKWLLLKPAVSSQPSALRENKIFGSPY